MDGTDGECGNQPTDRLTERPSERPSEKRVLSVKEITPCLAPYHLIVIRLPSRRKKEEEEKEEEENQCVTTTIVDIIPSIFLYFFFKARKEMICLATPTDGQGF